MSRYHSNCPVEYGCYNNVIEIPYKVRADGNPDSKFRKSKEIKECEWITCGWYGKILPSWSWFQHVGERNVRAARKQAGQRPLHSSPWMQRGRMKSWIAWCVVWIPEWIGQLGLAISREICRAKIDKRSVRYFLSTNENANLPTST